MIGIIDYGMGNVGSIQNMLLRIGESCVITPDPEVLKSVDKLILPGVGSFDNAVSNLNKLGLVSLLNDLVIGRRMPILGICLGMQLLTKSSEEGTLPGFGWIDAQTIRFKFEAENAQLRIPHMGWNTLDICRKGSFLDQLPGESRFYFVHSYHVFCNNEEDVIAKTKYGIMFHSVIGKGHITGTQFHPEKSHKFGLALLESFTENK